jgi:hypothetical protein
MPELNSCEIESLFSFIIIDEDTFGVSIFLSIEFIISYVIGKIGEE